MTAEAAPAHPLVCAECGRDSEPDAAGWRAYLDDDDQAVTFCPECAEAEVRVGGGARPGTRLTASFGFPAAKSENKLAACIGSRKQVPL
jgi:hypothetical protein